MHINAKWNWSRQALVQDELDKLEEKVDKTTRALQEEKADLKKVEMKIIVNEEVVHGTPKESRLAELEQRLPEEKPVEEKRPISKTTTKFFTKLAKTKFEVEETPKAVKVARDTQTEKPVKQDFS